MACTRQRFTGITPKVRDILVRLCKAIDVDITGTAGVTEAKGYRFEYLYDPATSTLELQCLKKPFYAPCGSVEKKVRDLVEAAKTPPDAT